MILPADFIPIEFRGMSFLTAIFLAGYGIAFYYVIKWIHDRISEVERTSATHSVEIAKLDNSAESVAKSLDIMRKDLGDAIFRLEDRFSSIQESIDRIRDNK